MLEIGKMNRLTVILGHSTGVYLDGGEAGKIFLASRWIPDTCQESDELDVFIYLDGEGDITATTIIPFAQVGDIAWLKVKAVNAYGAFLDWGLPKDLLVPFSEQHYPLEVGRHCFVKVLYDPEKGISGTTYIEEYLNDEASYLKEGQVVSLLIADKTELGVKAIVNNSFWGLLYQNEVFQPIKKGQKITGYIKHIREDRRIDLSLYPPGYAKVEGIVSDILEQLKQNGGVLPLGDKSTPEVIYARFGVSKKVFKQAIGGLFRQRLITITDNAIELVKEA